MTGILDAYYQSTDGGESAFSIEAASIRFGPGVLREIGAEARALGLKRVALITDRAVRTLAPFAIADAALRASGVDVAVFDGVSVEPTDRAMLEAAAFAADARVDGFVSLGGGSTIDTAKAANLFSTWPADFIDYVSAPIGKAKPVPGPLKPHIACPTTFGTASETTGIAIADVLEPGVKTGIVSRRLRPTIGVLDPDNLNHLPPLVIAANGFDVLSHAIESYTARPFTARPCPADAALRPLSQGANPYGDIACLEAIRRTVRFLERAVRNPGDREARQQLQFAGLLAGIGFGNAGNHLPHAMSYPVAGEVRGYRAPGYPADEPLVPHGIAVAVNAPAAFALTAEAAPERHRDVLRAFDDRFADESSGTEIGTRLAGRLIGLMRATALPNGLSGLGYDESDLPVLADGAFREKRLVDNAPRPVRRDDLLTLYRAALRYW